MTTGRRQLLGFLAACAAAPGAWAQAKPRKIVLGQSVPLSHAAAMKWAVSFAASRNIPVVYERDDTLLPAHAAAPNAGAKATRSSASK